MSYASTVLADGATTYWRLGEPSGTNANDETANNRDGTYVGSPTLGVTGLLTGDSNTAVTLDGSTQWLTVADSSSYRASGTASMSAEVWVNHTPDATFRRVISCANASAFGWELVSASATTSFTRKDVTTTDDLGTGSSLSAGRHYLAITYNGTSMRLYIDSVEILGSPITSARSLPADSTFRLGVYGPVDASSFNGTLDEFAFYGGVVLSAAQILNHWTLGTTISTPVWVSPADTVPMGLTPVLVFTSPVSTSAQHFELQLDTANTFNTANLRDLNTQTSQVGWEYFDGSVWQPFPSSGLPANKSGNNVRHTVQTALSMTTWYRQVRAGV